MQTKKGGENTAFFFFSDKTRHPQLESFWSFPSVVFLEISAPPILSSLLFQFDKR